MSRGDQVTEASKFGWADARDPLEVVDAKERSVPISLRHNRCGRRWAHAREGLEKTGIDTADTVSRSTPNQPSQARTRSTTGCTGAGRATTSSGTSSTIDLLDPGCNTPENPVTLRLRWEEVGTGRP